MIIHPSFFFQYEESLISAWGPLCSIASFGRWAETRAAQPGGRHNGIFCELSTHWREEDGFWQVCSLAEDPGFQKNANKALEIKLRSASLHWLNIINSRQGMTVVGSTGKASGWMVLWLQNSEELGFLQAKNSGQVWGYVEVNGIWGGKMICCSPWALI